MGCFSSHEVATAFRQRSGGTHGASPISSRNEGVGDGGLSRGGELTRGGANSPANILGHDRPFAPLRRAAPFPFRSHAITGALRVGGVFGIGHKRDQPASGGGGLFGRLVAGTGFEPVTFRL